MSGSTTAIVAIVVVAVVALAVFLLLIRLSARRPHHQRPQQDPMRGLVQGGQHVGGGRSVAPTRDAPVPEGGGEAPAIEEEIAAPEGHAARGSQPDREPRSSGSPMDL